PTYPIPVPPVSLLSPTCLPPVPLVFLTCVPHLSQLCPSPVSPLSHLSHLCPSRVPHLSHLSLTCPSPVPPVPHLSLTCPTCVPHLSLTCLTCPSPVPTCPHAVHVRSRWAPRRDSLHLLPRGRCGRWRRRHRRHRRHRRGDHAELRGAAGTAHAHRAVFRDDVTTGGAPGGGPALHRPTRTSLLPEVGGSPSHAGREAPGTAQRSGAPAPGQDQQLDRAAVQDHPRLLHGEHQIRTGPRTGDYLGFFGDYLGFFGVVWGYGAPAVTPNPTEQGRDPVQGSRACRGCGGSRGWAAEQPARGPAGRLLEGLGTSCEIGHLGWPGRQQEGLQTGRDWGKLGMGLGTLGIGLVTGINGMGGLEQLQMDNEVLHQQVEELKNKNLLLRAQLRQHGLEIVIKNDTH
uniref:Uncharacterized protein n=1 Tax=Geospiza parvula TaxID=87175 RepID=A0A8U8CGP6_GEOPR